MAQGAEEPAVMIDFQVDKVTYLTFTPDVVATVEFELSAARTVVVEYAVRELTRGSTIASGREELPAQAGSIRHEMTLPLRVDRMLGLLATVQVVDAPTGAVLARAERPFDVTNDLRTNFRYAGETYGAVSCALEPIPIGEGQTDMDFWSGVPVGTLPEDEIRALRSCFINAAQVSVEEGRGHFTCWEASEGNRRIWTKSAYLSKDVWEFSLDRMMQLYKDGPENGIHILPWTSGKGTRQEYFDREFPWIDPYDPFNFYPGCYLMNLDPEFHRPLTEEEKKMAHVDLHGAESWLEYVAEELYMITEFYNFQVMWWDNSFGTTHIPFTLNMLRNMWADRRPDVAPPTLMINGDAGFHSDVYWMEHNLPPAMDAYLALLRQVIKDRPMVDNGPATVFSGQWHPMLRSGQREAITDPRNIYNDLETTFMFRQLLFECIAADARLVGQQQWPRNALEWRILNFPEAFADHAKSWGFQTMFSHVYNARDVRPYPAAGEIAVTGIPFTLEENVADNALHLVARAPLSQPDTIYLHVFNYTGSTMQILDRRERPAKLDAVEITMPLPGFARDFQVQVFSPDFVQYGDVLEPETQCTGQQVTFEVPVDLYTLVVLRKKWL
jgi:hypothetical protein